MLYKFYLIIISLCIFGSCIENAESKTSGKILLESNSTLQSVTKSSAPTENGKTLYMKYCLACHQTDGSGVPGMYPPLQKSNWVTGDKKKLISVLLNGLEGEITVNDEIYNNPMPKQDYLTDKQIAQVLTHIRQNFENNGDSVKVKEVMAERKKL